MKKLISAQTRYRALPIIMEGIAAQRGYRIEIHNELQFAINRKDKIIYIPHLKQVGTDEDAICLEGGLDHELMHVDQTDPAIRVEHRLLHKLWNIMEDARGELGFFRKYPGAARNIRLTLEVLREKGRFSVPSEDDPFRVLCAFLLYELRAGVLGQTSFCEGLRAPTAKLARSLFGPLADQCLSLARAVVEHERDHQGSYKALDAARRIIALLSSTQPGSPEQPGQDGKGGDGTNKGGSENAQGQSSGADEPDPSNGYDEKGAKEAGSETGQKGDAEGDGDAVPSPSGSKSSGNDGAGKPSEDHQNGEDGDEVGGTQTSSSVGQSAQSNTRGQAKQSPGGKVTEAQRSAIGKALEQGRNDDDCPYSKGLEEHIVSRNGLGLTPSSTDVSYMRSELLDSRTGVVGSAFTRQRNLSVSNKVTLALSLKLEDLLEAFGKTETRYARSGRFDSDRAVRAVCGNRRAYLRKSVSETINTSICLLVDNSGSMEKLIRSGDRAVRVMDLANATTIGLGSVLEQFDVPFSVISFSTYPRLEHDFDDAWQKTLARYSVDVEDMTRMGEAYYHAVRKLTYRDEDRRIILMVTDGEPSSWMHFEASVKEAKRLGIETRTVLISPRDTSFASFKALGTVPATARTAQEIPKAIFATLESSLSS